jgi:hypothetical protein
MDNTPAADFRPPARPAAQAAAVEVNTGAMLAGGAPSGAIRLATDLIRHVWWPDQVPFSFDVEALHACLQRTAATRDWTHWQIRRYRAWAQVFFCEVASDRWAPLEAYYHVHGRRARPPQAPDARAAPSTRGAGALRQ